VKNATKCKGQVEIQYISERELIASDGHPLPGGTFSTLIPPKKRTGAARLRYFFVKNELVKNRNRAIIQGADKKMENTFMEKAMEINIESWRKVGYPIPEAYKNWCTLHGREDLLGIESDNFLPSAYGLASLLGVDLPADFVVESTEEPASESEISALIDLAIEQMARDFGVNIHEK